MKIFTLLLAIVTAQFCEAQNFNLNEEERFAYQVKQLDELIERFNGESHTLIQEYLKKNNPATSVDRILLMKTIFDSQNANWNLNEIKSFLDFVDDKAQPVLLNFEDDAWFAEAKCVVTYKGRIEKVNLVLRLQKEHNNGLKWVLVSAKSNFLRKNASHSDDYKIPLPTNSNNSMNPISHATEFMNLDIALKDKQNIANYIARDCVSKDLFTFIEELNSKTLSFERIDSIVYHFLQVEGWGFTVQKFKRPIKNSGWLVSSLTKMNQDDKQRYLASVLNISN